jgi:radical SAM superfamily enzyme YgiQ (UPF0313 family)
MMVARIDEEMAYYLKQAGLKKAFLAIESGSEWVRRNIICKPVTEKQIIRAVTALKKYEIPVFAFIVTGFPGESDQHRKESLQFIKSIDIEWANFVIACPLKGSRLYDICFENGYLYNYDIQHLSLRGCYIKTPEYQPEYIEYIAYRMNLEFNFLENYNMRKHNYEKALLNFNDVLSKYPGHAIAHYCVAVCYDKLANMEKRDEHFNTYKQIVSKDVFWKKYIEDFMLTDDIKNICRS